MTAAKKPAARTTKKAAPAPVEEVVEPEVVEAPKMKKVIEHDERAFTENFSAWAEEKHGNLLVHIGPIGWVGPTPLTIIAVRVEELRDLLNELLGE